jgi:superoxide dismutase, Cu-Zn family
MAMRNWRMGAFVLALMLGGANTVSAAELRADMRRATSSGPGEAVGTVTIADGPQGAVVRTDLKGLPPGQRGFHVHETGSCEPGPVNGKTEPAGAAGGHFDPQDTSKHAGPHGEGHLGDLPALPVAADGTASGTLTAPRIKEVSMLRGKAVIIHAGGDNYSDQPEPLGGGGARIACGVLQ